MASDKSELEAYLELQPNKLNRNVEILRYSDLPEDQRFPLYHISIDSKIKTFIPRLPDSVTDDENRTVPRLCVSRDILGCIEGYGHCTFDFIKNQYDYSIYAFEWEEALIPNSNVAGINSACNGSELWLVNYKKEMVNIKPTGIVGVLELTEILAKSNRSSERFPVPLEEFHFKLKPNEPIPILINGKDTIIVNKECNFIYQSRMTYPNVNSSNFSMVSRSNSKPKENKLRFLEWLK